MAQVPEKDPEEWLAKEDETPGPKPERPGEEITDPNAPDYAYKKYPDGSIEITRAPKGSGHEGTKLTSGVAFDAISALFSGTPIDTVDFEDPVQVTGMAPRTYDREDPVQVTGTAPRAYDREDPIQVTGTAPRSYDREEPIQVTGTAPRTYDREDPVQVTGDPSESLGFTKNAYGIPDAEEVSAWAMEQHKHESDPDAREGVSALKSMSTEDLEETLSRELHAERPSGGRKRSEYVGKIREILDERKNSDTEEPLSYSSHAVANRNWPG